MKRLLLLLSHPCLVDARLAKIIRSVGRYSIKSRDPFQWLIESITLEKVEEKPALYRVEQLTTANAAIATIAIVLLFIFKILTLS
jgi:hypothetical protein